jgi:hypothetical protein
MIRQAATAWLDHYQLCRLLGMSDLESRVGAVEAWDSVAGPAIAELKSTGIGAVCAPWAVRVSLRVSGDRP